jgi:tetratricopeptide (TPR) repeat protein
MKIFDPMHNPTLSERRKNAFAFITISIIILAIYSNTYNASWHFDDEPNIVDRTDLHLKELSWSGITKTFSWGPRIYRPVSCLSLALNYYFGNLNVFGYHLVNNLIHLLSALFLFLFIHQTLKLPILRKRYAGNAYAIALLATVFWASNPVQTQTITYIVQRMASMAGMFYIMTLYLYLKGRTTREKSSQIIFYVLCAIAALLSFGSKENTILLPVALFLYEILLLQEASLGEWLRHNKKLVIVSIICIVAITIIYLYFVQEGSLFSFMGRYKDRVFSLTERLLTEPRVIIYYISLLLYPVPSRLCVNHDISISHSLLDPPGTLLAILAILFIVIGAFIISRRRPLMAFCILFFFLNHLVESTFIPLELVFEHRNYIPSMLFFVPVSVFLIKAVSHYSRQKIMRAIFISFIILLLITQGHSTFIRNITWKTEESLWLDCIEKYPDLWRPHHNLARYYEKNNRLGDAISRYLITISTKKTSVNRNEDGFTYYNLGWIYQNLKKEKKALYYYHEAERRKPKFAPIYINRGALLFEKGLLDDAMSEYQKAIKYNKKFPSAYSNLGFLQLIKGETGKATHNLELALKKGPGNARIFRHLGHAYRTRSLYGKAFLMFQKSRELDPHDPITLLHLVELHSTTGMKTKMADAIGQFFNLFHENDQQLQRFLREIVNRDMIAAAILPDRTKLLTLLAEECQRRSLRYKALADYLLQ